MGPRGRRVAVVARWSRSACWWPAAWSPPRARATRRRWQPARHARGPRHRAQGRSPAQQDDGQREAAAAPAALRRADHRRRREGRASAGSSASPTRRRSTTSSTSRSSSRGCTSRSCSPTTRSTATARSSRSRSGAASSFDPSVATADDTIGARESATVGIKQIYSPMVDVSHEPRWGRISEGAGEDPYLGSVFAAARVKAAQGTDYSRARQGRRRASSTSPRTASPRAAASTTRPTCPSSGCATSTCRRSRPPIDAGADTVMCSFNAINGVPGCAEPRDRDRHPQEASGASTASSRATTPPSPSCGPARR